MRYRLSKPFVPRVNQVILCTLLTLMILTLAYTTATASIRFTQTGQWGGSSTALAVANGRAYIGVGPSVLIYDISDPVFPAQIGSFTVQTPSGIASIYVSGNYAYVLAWEAGLYIADISDPASPSVVGFFTTNQYARNVVVSGNFAYVADWSGGLKIIYIAYPAHPSQVGSFAISGYCYGLAISGNYVYLTDNTGLCAIDVSNPANPTKVGTLSGVYAQDIAISGNRLYTASGVTNGFRIFDISSPVSPVSVGVCDTPGEALGVAVSGNYAYVGDSLSGLEIIDISNAASPTVVSTFDTVDSAGKLAIYGNQVLVADRWDGMRAINVASPASPTEAWACASGSVGGVAVSGNTAFAACRENDANTIYALNTLDTSDPSRVVQNGSCTIPGSGSVDLMGNLAFIAGSNGLHIADVTTPSSPSLVGTYASSSSFLNHAAFFDHYACVANGDSGIRIIDVANPASPVQVGSYNTSGSAYAVAVSGGYAYVADGRNGMVVLSLSNPAGPALITTYPTSSDAYDIKISDSYVYLAAAGLQVLDITNPIAPTLVTQLSYAPGGRLALSGSYLYTSDTMGYANTVAMFDVSDPANPIVVGRISPGGYMTVSGDRVFTARSGILRIFEAGQSDKCIITGYVKDPSGSRVYGATVSSNPGAQTTTTDATGRYELDYVDPGTYTLTASGPEWTPASTTVTVADGSTVQAPDIVLAFGGISGCVRNDLGVPLSGVTITGSGSQPISATTDANGNYTLTNLLPGYYYPTVSKPGHISVTQTVYVTGGQVTTFSPTLQRTGSIGGFVRDNLGRPISGISVRITGRSAGTDASGAYLITDAPPGTYNVTASDPSWTSVIKNNIVVTAGGSTTLDFTLQLGTISGAVKDKADRPISGATVSSSVGGYSATTDSSGLFTIANVGPTYSDSRGPTYYTFTAAKAGYQSLNNTVHVTGGQTTTSNFALIGYGSISGTVNDHSGEPVSGAQVTTTYSCYTYTAVTDPSGHYSMQSVYPANGINLVASRANYGTTMKTINVSDSQAVECNLHLADVIALDLVSSTVIAGTPCGIGVDNGIAVVASGTTGLQMLNVSQPQTPVSLSTFDTSGYSYEVALRNNYAYIADDTFGLNILNISNPSAPVMVGSYNTTGSSRAVDVVGNYAYVADGSSGLQIIDVSNPTTPVRLGGYDTSGSALAVDVVGDYAYIADGSCGLRIIDVRSPASPVPVGQYSISGGSYSDVVVSGNYAYVADSLVGQFLVFNISVPTSPTLAGAGYVTGTTKPQKISISGSYAYVGTGLGGITAYDISMPNEPCLVRQYSGCRGSDVAVSNGLIYAADSTGKLVILAPASLKITNATPNKSTNSEAAVAATLTGFGFEAGATVKLVRSGCADIVASETLVADPGLITCKFNPTGAAPGIWSVVVTNPDGLSTSLQGGFAVVLSDTAPHVVSSNRSVRGAAMAASSRWRFTLYGQVAQKTSDSFLIDDGSGAPVKVYAPGYTRVDVNDFVAATGTLDVSSAPAVLITTDARIEILAAGP